MEPIKEPDIHLLQKYLDGTITDAESVSLFAFLKERSPEGDPAFEELLQQVYQQSFTEQPMLTRDASKRMLNRLIASANSAGNTATDRYENDQKETPVRPLHRKHRTWIRYAAAAVLVGTVSVWLFMNNDTKETTPPDTKIVANDIPAGYNKAVLKMKNGEQINLDSTEGNLVNNEQFAVSNKDGKLDYQAKTGIADYHTLSTPRGGQYRLQLPDGTIVWLNAASSITYPTTFIGQKYRGVTVTGETYFEVKKNKAQPFIVDVHGKAAVEVLGTHFNVNAYDDEPGIYTTLLEGSIRMRNVQQEAILTPGQQAQVSNKQIKVVDNADTEMAVAWKNGSFQFDHASIEEVLRQLARWYDIEIEYEKGVPGVKVSGEIKRDLNLTQALFILDKMGVHARIDGKQLLVTP